LSGWSILLIEVVGVSTMGSRYFVRLEYLRTPCICILWKRWLDVFCTTCIYVPKVANNYSICLPAFDYLKCVFCQGGKNRPRQFRTRDFDILIHVVRLILLKRAFGPYY